MRALSDQQIDVLAGQRHVTSSDPLTLALVDLRDRLFARGGGRWMARFLANVQDYFDASVWEAENRACGRVPGVETYVRLRDLTGAVKTCFDIFELIDGPLAITHRSDPRLATLMQLANRAICWSNDIFSVDKELVHGDFHNLVLTLRHERSSSLGEAIAVATRMHDAAIAEFEAMAQTTDATHARFVDALKGWIRANYDWSIETGRYRPAEPAVMRPPPMRTEPLPPLTAGS